MANKKFSEFTSQTDSANVQFVVGYNGSDNVRISPGNLLGAYLPLAGGTLTGNLILDDGAGSSPQIQFINANNDTGEILLNTSGKLEIQTGGTDRLVISSGDTEFTGDISLADNKKAIFGAGSDLEIYHDGSHSYIKDSGTGNLIVNATNFVVNNSGDTQNMITATDGGAVTLFTAGVAKLATTSTGVSVTGNANFADNGKALFGDSDDLEIYHDSSDSFYNNTTGDMYFINKADDKDIIFQTDNGSGGYTAYLTLDGSTTHSYFSAGNVGIGTTSPGNFTGLSFSDPILDVNGLIQSRVGNISLGGSDYRKAALFTSTGTAAPYLSFNVGSSGSSSSTSEAMRIDSSGNVGIGNAAPTAKLSVSGGNIAIDNGSSYILGGATSGNTIIGRIKSTAGVYTVDGEGTRNIRLGSETNGEVARIDNTNGRLGIGTTAPDYALDVNGDIRVGTSFSSQKNIYFGDSNFSIRTENNYTASNLDNLRFAVADNADAGFRFTNVNDDELLYIKSDNGNTGIGTVAPTAKLQVVGLAEHADNSAATTAGLTAGAFYRTGDLLKVVH